MSLFVKLVYAFFYITSGLGVIDSARILGLFPTHSRSHLINHLAVVEALAESGHNVTVVSTYPSSKKNPPYRYIYLDVPQLTTAFLSGTVNNRDSFHTTLKTFLQDIPKISNNTLHHPLMNKLMEEESFDLVIQGYFLNEFLFGVAAHFKCPLVLSFTSRPISDVNDLVGNPQEFAYVPTLLSKKQSLNGFFERLNNFISSVIVKDLPYRYYLRVTQEFLYRENFPADKFPTFDEMMKNVSLVLTGHHFSQGAVRPDVPAVIQIGGIQIKDKPDPLPEDIQSILENSTDHGAIYFSLGTNIYKGHLDPSKIKIIFEVLSKLPQTVLCKWSEDELPSNSSNIYFRKWLPQDDVLHHPNVKLFITHGGMGSVTEAQYHGVPMVGIPLFNDQHANIENIRKAGYGLRLDYMDLNEKDMRSVIEEVLYNQSYTETIQRFSRVFRDRPMSAKQTAVYWVEYVIRHHGASHLQSPAIHMNSLQLYFLDVIGCLLAVTYVVFKVFQAVYLCLRKKCWLKKLKQ